ncbi:MAG: hypothetical protein WC990_08345 [Sphaerochaetaceae bacterium]
MTLPTVADQRVTKQKQITDVVDNSELLFHLCTGVTVQELARTYRCSTKRIKSQLATLKIF